MIWTGRTLHRRLHLAHRLRTNAVWEGYSRFFMDADGPSLGIPSSKWHETFAHAE